MASEAVLVTGGAGYIGAHAAKALAESGFLPVVFDNLSSGHRGAVRWGDFVEGDIRDSDAVLAAIERYNVSAVMHFAGLIEVARSVARPDLFYDVNIAGTMTLLDAMRRASVRRLVFSSSAAVYGDGASSKGAGLIGEDSAKSPASPYGETKLAGERMIAAYCAAFGMSAVALRYFNAAGSDASGLIGEAHDPETHLIPLAIDAVLRRRPALTVFGVDYPTSDGSCLRDYVHVSDVAAAHVAALRMAQPEGSFEALNIGTGQGYSVLEVVAAVSRAAGRPVPHTISGRRAGDPPALIADPARATALLGWKPEVSSLAQIVESALAWRAAPTYGLRQDQPG
jgi:UDP-glucose 4-epimerase/UDP-arabinose 4-epimerase